MPGDGTAGEASLWKAKQVAKEAHHVLMQLPSGETKKISRIRDIRRFTSKDFRNWSEPEYIGLGDTPLEHLYKNSAIPYYRRPDILLMFPKRFLPTRKFHPDWRQPGLSDVVFMFSRDGLNFDRRFMEAFLRPGPNPLELARAGHPGRPHAGAHGCGERCLSTLPSRPRRTRSGSAARCCVKMASCPSMHPTREASS